MRPRLGRFDLGGQPQQRHLVTRPADELDPDRQRPLRPVRPVQRDRHAGWPLMLYGAVNGVNRFWFSKSCAGSASSRSAPTFAGGWARVGVSTASYAGRPLELGAGGRAQGAERGVEVQRGQRRDRARAASGSAGAAPPRSPARHRQHGELDRPQVLEQLDHRVVERRLMVLDAVPEPLQQAGGVLVGRDAVGMDDRARDGRRDVAADPQPRRARRRRRRGRSRSPARRARSSPGPWARPWRRAGRPRRGPSAPAGRAPTGR